MAVHHVIVVRKRRQRIVLSTDELRIAPGEHLRWVSEKGKPFRIRFKHGAAPFGGGGVHESHNGEVHVGPRNPIGPEGPPLSGGPNQGPDGPVPHEYEYTVTMEGVPELDPKIVFEIPPDDRGG